MRKTLLSLLTFLIVLSPFNSQVFAEDETYQKKVNYKVIAKKHNKNSTASNEENTLQYNLDIKQRNNEYSVKFNGSIFYNNQTIKFNVKNAHVTEYDYDNKPFLVVDAKDTYKLNNEDVPVTYYIEKYNDREYIAIAIGHFGSDNFDVIVSNEPLINKKERKSLVRETKKVSSKSKSSEEKVYPLADFNYEDFDYAEDQYSNGYTHKERLYLENDLYDNEDGSAIAMIYTYSDNVREGLLDYYTFVNNVRAFEVNTEFKLLDEDESQIDGFYPGDDPSEYEWLDWISTLLEEVGVSGVYTQVIQTLIENFGNDLDVDADDYGTYVEFSQYPDDDQLMDLDQDGEGLPYKIFINKDTNSTDDDLKLTTHVTFYSMVYDDSVGGSDYPFLFEDDGSVITVDLAAL